MLLEIFMKIFHSYEILFLTFLFCRHNDFYICEVPKRGQFLQVDDMRNICSEVSLHMFILMLKERIVLWSNYWIGCMDSNLGGSSWGPIPWPEVLFPSEFIQSIKSQCWDWNSTVFIQRPENGEEGTWLKISFSVGGMIKARFSGQGYWGGGICTGFLGIVFLKLGCHSFSAIVGSFGICVRSKLSHHGWRGSKGDLTILMRW